MQLAIFNGSPRKSKSNSTILANQFLNGYYDNTTHNHPIHYLASVKKTDSHIEAFNSANTVMIIFPLYTDAMPGQVKYFFEQLEQIDSKGKQVLFFVQSGFPESHHSTYVAKYLEKFAKRNQWNHIGTIIKGGVEGIQIMPEKLTRKFYNRLSELGKHVALSGKLNPTILKKFKTPYQFSPLRQFIFRIMRFTGFADWYWNSQLKKHKAYAQRYAQPYAPINT